MVYHLVLIQLALNWNIHSEYAQVIQVVGMFQPPVVFFGVSAIPIFAFPFKSK